MIPKTRTGTPAGGPGPLLPSPGARPSQRSPPRAGSSWRRMLTGFTRGWQTAGTDMVRGWGFRRWWFQAAETAGCKRRKGELGRQLEEMIRRVRREEEGMVVGDDVEEVEEKEEEESVGPGTPGRAGTGQARIGWDVGEDVLDCSQQGAFTFLLMMTCQVRRPGASGDDANAIPNATIS